MAIQLETEIKPCPFCGKDPVLAVNDDPDDPGYSYVAISCRRCMVSMFEDCTGYNVGDINVLIDAKAAVAARWNRRWTDGE